MMSQSVTIQFTSPETLTRNELAGANPAARVRKIMLNQKIVLG